MPSRISLVFSALVAASLSLTAQTTTPVVLLGDEPGVWREIFASVGLTLGEASQLQPEDLPARVNDGAIAILQGPSAFAEQFGIRKIGTKNITTRQIRDMHAPALPIIWERSIDLPQVRFPDEAIIFSKEHWTGAPVIAGLRKGKGAVLWVAAAPGPEGYTRFPYLMQALADLGLKVPARS